MDKNKNSVARKSLEAANRYLNKARFAARLDIITREQIDAAMRKSMQALRMVKEGEVAK